VAANSSTSQSASVGSTGDAALLSLFALWVPGGNGVTESVPQSVTAHRNPLWAADGLLAAPGSGGGVSGADSGSDAMQELQRTGRALLRLQSSPQAHVRAVVAASLVPPPATLAVTLRMAAAAALRQGGGGTGNGEGHGSGRLDLG
jgi:hypothetical protein